MKPKDDCTPKTAEPAPQCVLQSRARLGENPVWSTREQCLYWIDVGDWPEACAPAAPSSLHRFNPATGDTRRWDFQQTVGSFALEEGGGVLLAMATGLYRVDLQSSHLTMLVDAPYDCLILRFNDGRCDPTGRFWVGTCQRSDPALPSGSGSLYRYDGYSLDIQLDDVSVANGMAWSPDGQTLYFADSQQRTVWVFDYDLRDARISNRRIFAQVAPGIVLDGAAVDTDGGYWIALYDAGKVVRYRPDGALDREIELPVSKPTKVAFGGPRLETLYITSASHRLTADQLEEQPLAGGLFALQPGVRGLPEPRFRQRTEQV
jgi:sugar lactone lactonase YvrE